MIILPKNHPHRQHNVPTGLRSFKRRGDALPKITTSSLADIGGGGGAFMPKTDHSERIARGVEELVAIPRQDVDQGKSRPPEPIV